MPETTPVLPPDDPRYCVARLKLILNTLPATIFANPLGVLVAALALYLGRPDFGDVPVARLIAAVAVHAVASTAAFIVWRRNRKVMPATTAKVRRQLIGLQVLIGIAWGAVCWLFWCEGSAANTAFNFIVMAMALWAMALTRCAVRAVFLTGVGVLLSLVMLRFALSDGRAAHAFLVMMPLWSGYMVFSGMATREKLSAMLRGRFVNEDLSRQLAQARDEAIEKRQEAETASKSKTAFLANMSHELRTPLNAIIGFSEIIASQALGPNHQRYGEYAGDIHASGTHLLALINEILDVAKIEAGRMEIAPRPLDVGCALEGIERIMAVRAGEKQLDIRYGCDPTLGEILADERAFRQILLNLLSNAVKFTPPGGSIAVRCDRRDDGMVLSVADNGSGIAADKLKLLFQPFTQVDNRFDHQHGGSGLGLALVQGLARLHGGRAWIESEEGSGTTVYVYFPLASVKREIKVAMQ